MFRRDYRTRYRGVADLLNWAALPEDGVILNKDGSLLAGWRFRGPDFHSSTPEALEDLSLTISRGLQLLGDSWMVNFDAVRYAANQHPPVSSFPYAVCQLIDEERRQQYRRPSLNLETDLYITVCYLPPSDAKSGFLRWLLGRPNVQRSWDEVLAPFLRSLDELQGLLSGTFQISRLDSTSLLSHLHRCLTGLSQPIGVPEVPCYLDYLLATADLVGGMEPKIGSMHLRVIGVTGFPSRTVPSRMGPLLSFGFPHHWAVRFLPLDPPTAVRHITLYRRRWFQRRFGLIDFLRNAVSEPKDLDSAGDQDALQMVNDSNNALTTATSGAARFGYCTAALVLFDEDVPRLRNNLQEALRELRAQGFGAQIETLAALEAFHASLPGHAYPSVRRPLVTDRNCADLVVTTSVWSGEPTSPNPYLPPGSPALLWAATGGSTPFRLNLHSGDVGHSLIIGPTGAGKSSLVALLQAQFFRYPDSQVYVFDKGYSSLPLVHAAAGRHYDLAADQLDEHRFSPLSSVHRDSELSWALMWLEQLLVLQGVQPNTQARNTLQRALELLAQSPGRTLTQYLSKVQDHTLRLALRPYTVFGPYHSTFDAEDELSFNHRYQVFEMSSAMELDDKFVVPLLLLLFHRIEERLDGRPTLIVLEEAWTYLGHSLFADRIQLWLRELRKKNAAVVFVTQSVADLERSPLRAVIMESCATKILLPAAEALTPSGASLYRGIGLNDRQIELLARATRKRDYYVFSRDGQRLIDLTLGPVALSFVGATLKPELTAVRQLQAAHGPTWPAHWLRERKLDDAAHRFEELLDASN